MKIPHRIGVLREIHQETPSGVIRLTASQNFELHYLTGCISRFSDRNPNISFDLVINDAIMNMIEERFGRGDFSGPVMPFGKNPDQALDFFPSPNTSA